MTIETKYNVGDEFVEINPAPNDQGKTFTVTHADDEFVTGKHGLGLTFGKFRYYEIVKTKNRGEVIVIPDLMKQETLKTRHVPHALRAYVINGVIQVLDDQGEPLKALVDVTIEQPLKAAQGRELTIAKVTCYINLFDSRDEALKGINVKKVKE